MAELDDELVRLRTELGEADDYLLIGELRSRLPQLETEMGRPDLWDDANRAREVQTEFSSVKEDLDLYDRLSGEVDDLEVMLEMASEDASFADEAETLASKLSEQFNRLELRALYTGK